MLVEEGEGGGFDKINGIDLKLKSLELKLCLHAKKKKKEVDSERLDEMN